MAHVLPIRTAQRLAQILERANQAAYAFNEARSVALEMLGLDPSDMRIGFDLNTGIVNVPQEDHVNGTIDVTPDVKEVA